MREPYEREAGHIAGTRHIELVQLTAQAASVERERPVVFYCRVGGALDDGRPGVPRLGLRGLLDERRPATLGRRGQAARARGRQRGRPLRDRGRPRRRRRWRLPSTRGVTSGEGYAVGDLDALGDGPGFRKVRKGLDVTAFGVNAIVMPPGHRERLSLPRRAGGAVLRAPRHDRDGVRRRHRAAPARRAVARVDAATCARSATSGEVDAIYLIAGGKDGYIGRDGRVPEGEERASERSTISPAAAEAALRRYVGGGRECLQSAAHKPSADDPARGDRAAHEPLLGPRRPARERDRLARGSELRRARLPLAQRGPARARARPRRASGSSRSPRTSARRPATASWR